MTEIKSGYVAIIGKPNSGKSTLLNSILKQKLSITTNKPQTTRKRIVAIYNDDDCQIVFLDTPGILKPAYLLQEKFVSQIQISIKDADVIIVLLDVTIEKNSKNIFEDELFQKILGKSKKKIIAAVNKIDLVDTITLSNVVNKYSELTNVVKVIPISAAMNFNVDKLILEIKELLPKGPRYYPEDQIAEETERFFISELIREKIFELYSEEIPFSSEVLIEDYKERKNNKDFISAVIIIEKESQKPIIIGKNGIAIKRLGQEARRSIENFLGKEVYLELRVKVKVNWRNDAITLKHFGYDLGVDD